jgi:hypothetical protein
VSSMFEKPEFKRNPVGQDQRPEWLRSHSLPRPATPLDGDLGEGKLRATTAAFVRFAPYAFREMRMTPPEIGPIDLAKIAAERREIQQKIEKVVSPAAAISVESNGSKKSAASQTPLKPGAICPA